jgi:hypothetical protein
MIVLRLVMLLILPFIAVPFLITSFIVARNEPGGPVKSWADSMGRILKFVLTGTE